MILNFKSAFLLAALLVCKNKVDARGRTLKSHKSKSPKSPKSPPKGPENEQDLQLPCMKVVLTGTMGGPGIFDGLAGSGTLVTFGTEGSGCSDGARLQFDIGRGTTIRLSQLGLQPTSDIDAIFLTHIHSDHVDDLSNFMQYKWHFFGPPIDIVCSEDTIVGDRVMSCTNLVANIDAAFKASGEIDQRLAENGNRNPGGPSALANVNAFPLIEEISTVWQKSTDIGEVTVEAIRINHVGGSAAYRVTTPAGSVVISGDAANDASTDTRPHSTSDNVEMLARGSDVLVHAAIHPVMRPDGGSGFPPLFYNRQSTAPDIGSMAERAGVSNVMLSHLIPSINNPVHVKWAIPDGPVSAENYEEAVISGGYTGIVHVGGDLTSLKIP